MARSCLAAGLLLGVTFLGCGGSKKNAPDEITVQGRPWHQTPAEAKTLCPCGWTVIYAPGETPVAASDGKVFDLQSGQAVGNLGAAWGHRDGSDPPRALSPDGKLLAVGRVDDNRVIEVKLVSAADGQPVRTLVGSAHESSSGKTPEFLGFAGNERVVCVTGLSNSRITTWNATNGNGLADIQVGSRGTVTVAATLDGKHLAWGDGAVLTVYEVDSGKVAARMPAMPRNSDCIGAAFSKDGRQIAALYTSRDKGDRVACFDLEGKTLCDHALGGELGINPFDGPTIVWAPGQSGWLLGRRCLVDRQTGFLAWAVHTREGEPVIADRFLDKDNLLVRRQGIGSDLQVIPFPWQEITPSLDAVRAKADALLAPGDKVTLQLEVDKVRFAKQPEVTDELRKLLAGRIAVAGLEVADGQAVVLEAKYTELPGSKREIRTMTRSTGVKLQETRVQLEMKLTAPGSDQPLWSAKIERGRIEKYEGMPGNDRDLRNQGYKELTARLKQLLVPGFIPKD